MSDKNVSEKLEELYQKQYLLKIKKAHVDHKLRLVENAIESAEVELFGSNQQKMF